MNEKMETAMKGIYDSLTDEQKEQAKTCKDMDEFMKLAGEWGIELPDEFADAVAGGRIYDRIPMHYQSKLCERCNKNPIPTNSTLPYCDECANDMRKQGILRYPVL